MALVSDNGVWTSLRTIVRMLDPIIFALQKFESDGVFVSAVYRWFRWLRYHSAYGVTSPEQEADQSQLSESGDAPVEHDPVHLVGIQLLSDTVERIAAAAPGEPEYQNTAPDEERLVAGRECENVTAHPLGELQVFFREKIRSYMYVHTNAMGIAFMLDPAMDLDDFVDCDDGNVDEQVRKRAQHCGLLTSTTGVPKLTAAILKFKSTKRRGEEMHRETYSMSSPRDCWSAKSDKKYPLL
ncbi:hypothetical protein PC129_g21389 [Phytophthora cactorum]|nr:hypothetical protein PC114_g19977 [Phytophthora cactorum]KAG2892489.1 hypothetical protein PC117_g24010 [Phytophthora cactorum]KAG3009274.1 hypothetical protein PC120_g15716 [Phytophthora cactorum]KAG3207572.1 hypothetical protein PC129_g21389 [Phytophthora cactorum]KAG4050169.1 hypothetical protein PC123_g14584 [Phytophthora cactorum]